LSKIFENIPNDAIKVFERNIRFDDKQKPLVTRFLSFGLYGLILRWIIEDIPLTPREVALLIDDLSKGGWLI
ncbi:MAG: TetR family transcriptional regulator C-terminal domain-containing protein, partial [Spirochaetales bacterium]|nr:TetR family transcriptional regulator C-terminal domain-containing protein [Spirochaetales bacterium]